MNKRTILLLLATLLLGAASWWFVQKSGDTKTTLAGADRAFAVKDTNSIGKIFLADRLGNKTTLVRQGKEWTYNGQYTARPNAIKNLLDAIARVNIQYKPPYAAVENMVKNLSTEGIKVEIYDKEDQLIKAYYVGGSTPDERGTYMILDGYEQPYVCEIPGWTGNIRFRYNLLRDEWRDRHLFAAEIEEIQSVSVEYPQQRNKSFRLERQGKDFNLTPFYDITPRINKPVAQGKLEQYLVGFGGVQASRFMNQAAERDSIERMMPFTIITLAKTNGDTLSSVLFPFYVDPAIDEKTGKVVYAERIPGYYIRTRSGDFMSIQHEVIAKLLWDYVYFFE